MRQSSRVLLFWGLIVTVGASVSLVTRAQSPAAAPPADILPALLTEVRGLRTAMEQMAAAGPRVQLTLGRLQLQEQRINNLVRRLEQVKSEAVQRDYDRLAERMREMNDSLPELNESGRRQADLELKELKRELSRLGSEVQRLQSEEALLNTEIANEQARWTDFNQRLDELERSLIRR